MVAHQSKNVQQMIRVMLELKVRVKYRVDALKVEKQVGGVLNNVKETSEKPQHASSRSRTDKTRPGLLHPK